MSKITFKFMSIVSILMIVAFLLIAGVFFTTSSKIIITLVMVLIFLAVNAIIFILTKKLIGNPIHKILDVTEALAIGNTENKIQVKGNDEISALMNSINKVSEGIKQQALFADKISQGEVEISIEPKSNKDLLSISMQKIVETLQALIEGGRILTIAAAEGDFTARGNSEIFQGGFNKLVRGFNVIMGTLVGHFDNVPMSIAFIDKNYEIKYVNNKVAEILNMDKKEIIGRKCYELLHLDVCNSELCPARSSFEKDTTVEREAQQGSKYFSIKTVPYKDRENIVGVMELIIDHTEEKKAVIATEKRAKFQAIHAQRLQQSLEKLANGQLDIDTEIDEADEDTEIIRSNYLRLNNSLKATTESLKSYIEELSDILAKMAGRNFNITIEREYLGDFSELKDSINHIVEQLSSVLMEIRNAAEQVETGSEQVAISSQSLSQGASVQASSVEEISATVTQVAEQIKENAANATKANTLSIKAKEDAQSGNAQMAHMLRAMNEINESSKNISNIIKVIDEIAFQTNILALNAAVEAARAGEHGKGFAVVAEEVRNLAARSAKAAKETTDLIDNSIKKVEEGSTIAKETAEALDKIVKGVTDAVEIVGLIAEASNQQAVAMSEINHGIEQISSVTQSNTATAEQSASASEEMAGQALMLKSMIEEFEFKHVTTKKLAGNSQNTKKIGGPKKNSPEISLEDDHFGKY